MSTVRIPAKHFLSVLKQEVLEANTDLLNQAMVDEEIRRHGPDAVVLIDRKDVDKTKAKAKGIKI